MGLPNHPLPLPPGSSPAGRREGMAPLAAAVVAAVDALERGGVEVQPHTPARLPCGRTGVGWASSAPADDLGSQEHMALEDGEAQASHACARTARPDPRAGRPQP